jgi:putative membrane protein
VTIWRGAMVSLSIGAGVFLLGGGAARAADTPDTAQVLEQLHQANQKEIAAGKMAEKSGKSREVKDYGKMLQKDHAAADKKVTALAKDEKVNLAGASAAADMGSMASDPKFDSKFAEEMLADHKKDLASVTDARDHTPDAKLKKLLDGLVPTLQKHEDTAQKIIDSEDKK